MLFCKLDLVKIKIKRIILFLGKIKMFYFCIRRYSVLISSLGWESYNLV